MATTTATVNMASTMVMANAMAMVTDMEKRVIIKSNKVLQVLLNKVR